MANFDEDIIRITEEVLSDGTVDRIIREQVVKCFENAISNSFKWGELEQTIKDRVKNILVPFIESYDMSEYIVKLDQVLSDVVNSTSLVENKKILENFQYLMVEPTEKEIKLSEIFKEYKCFVSRNMEIEGRKVSFDDGTPEYEEMAVNMEFEEEDERSWSSFRYATVDFTVDDQNQEDDLNRTLRLSLWDGSRKPGWEIRTECNPAISSLRHLDKFDLLMVRLQRADVRVIDDVHHEDDYVYSDTKPEPTYE